MNLYNKIKFFFQRRTRGFDDSELWDLDIEFLKWILPRLKEFNKKSKGLISIPKQDMNEMIEGFEVYYNFQCFNGINDSIYADEKLNKSLNLFVKYFNNLWI